MLGPLFWQCLKNDLILCGSWEVSIQTGFGNASNYDVNRLEQVKGRTQALERIGGVVIVVEFLLAPEKKTNVNRNGLSWF